MAESVWKHFKKQGFDKAVCTYCSKSLCCSGGTKGLSSHLRTQHNIETSNSAKRKIVENPEKNVEKVKKQKTILNFVKYVSLEETVSRLATESNMSIRMITKTEYLRQKLAADFPRQNLPKNQSDVIKLVKKFYDKVKQETIDKIQELKDEGKKFSMTLDEWTSLRNVRFLNINIHYAIEDETRYINLGMVRIKGSCPAEIMLRLVSFEKVFDFKIYSTE
jgi:hypothetical protein